MYHQWAVILALHQLGAVVWIRGDVLRPHDLAYRRLSAAVAASDWPTEGGQLAIIRQLILTNLVLGLVTGRPGRCGPGVRCGSSRHAVNAILAGTTAPSVALRVPPLCTRPLPWFSAEPRR
jgi:hypothetical protein